MQSVCFVKKNAKRGDLDNVTKCLEILSKYTIRGYAIGFFENKIKIKNSIFTFFDIPDNLDYPILCFSITPKSPDDLYFMLTHLKDDIIHIPQRKEIRTEFDVD